MNEAEWVAKAFEELFEIGNGRDYKHLGKVEIPVYGSGGYMLSVNDYLFDGESVYSTGIPVCILVLKKCKKQDDVLFINACEHF